MSINIDKIAKGLSKFQNPANIVSVAIIEATVTAGRSYRGYKRGGKEELRERVFEESACGLIWLFGAKKLSDFGDWIGKKIFNLKDLDLDIGKDALRDPFGLAEPALKNKLAVFKTVKTFASVAATTLFIGMGIPRIKQAMTKRIRAKENQNKDLYLCSKNELNMDNFLNKNKKVAFKGNMDVALSLAHNLENNATWRLLSSDLGIATGRAASARNKDEAIEYLFRDLFSSYGYMFAAPNVIWLLNKLTSNKEIHPEALTTLRDGLKEKLKDGVGLEEFKNNTFNGIKQNDLFNKIKFEKDVVELESLKDILTPELFKKAEEMSKLQPKRNGKSLLTSLQVKDVLSDSWLSEPKLLKDITEKATWGKSSDPRKFIDKKRIDKIRESLNGFTESFYNSTKKKGLDKIDYKMFENFAKKNIIKSTIFTVIGNLSAMFLLAWIIPKLQHKLTAKRTGTNKTPGFEGNK